MNQQEKQDIVADLRQDFTNNQSAFLIGIKGLSVAQLQSLRKNIRQQGGKIRLAKNTLMEIASRDLPGASELVPYFKDQVALVLAPQEPQVVAKALAENAKQHELLKIVAGYVDFRLVDEAGVQMLALLPSRQVLLAKTCGTLKAPIVNCVAVLNLLTLRLLYVLKEAANKKTA